MPESSRPSVAILMATFNGGAALSEQLDSFAAQTLPPSRVIVSDDGSTDDSRDRVRRFIARHPDLGGTLGDGPRRGAAANFLSLLADAPEEAAFVAVSDQDDVWLPGKIARGVSWLRKVPAEQPALYCGRTLECDADLGHRRLSRRAGKRPSFAHALVQNIAGGNTMMLNAAGVALLRRALATRPRVVVHDWWIYQMISGAGGVVLFDDVPQVLYRQHAGNVIGANRGLGSKLWRLRKMLSGRFRRWNTINIRALLAVQDMLTPENRALLERFAHGRNSGLVGRMTMLVRTGVYRQGIAGQVSLWLAAMLGRL